LIEKNHDVEVKYSPGSHSDDFSFPSITELLGNLYPYSIQPRASAPYDVDRERLPFAELLEFWSDSRSSQLKDSDGLEIVRAYLLAQLGTGTIDGSGTSRLTRAYARSGCKVLRRPNVLILCMRWILK